MMTHTTRNRRARRSLFTLALALALVSSSALRAAPLLPAAEEPQSAKHEPPRLVLLFAPCTVSKSFLSPYNENVPYTPSYAGLAAQGVTFEAHRTEAGSSGIAYAALFSGAQVDRHGVAQHPSMLSDNLYMVAEAFADSGYLTFFWNRHGMASEKLNYAQGVRHESVVQATLSGQGKRFRGLLGVLRAFPQKRAFIMVNMAPTHGPYKVENLPSFLAAFPSERSALEPQRRDELTQIYHRNYLRLAYNFPDALGSMSLSRADVPALADTIEQLYASNIWALDTRLGSVLDAIDEFGLRASSVIAVTADHGEVMYREHEVFPWTHSSSLTPEVIEVPMIIRAPGVAPGRYAGVTRSIDVYPTLLGLAGIPVPTGRGIQGQDLSEVLFGRKPPPTLSAYSHTGGLAKPVVEQLRRPHARATWGRRMVQYPTGAFRHASTAVRRGNLVVRLMSIDGESFQPVAFDRASDPYEAIDIFDPSNPAHAAAADDLQSYKDHIEKSLGASAEERLRHAPSESEQEELLRSLGYIE